MPAIPESEATYTESPWWRAPKDRAHEPVFSTVRYLISSQPERSKLHWFAFRLYAGLEATNRASSTYKQITPNGLDRGRLALNVARSCVDAVHSKTIQSKPKPTFLTSGGDFSAQRKAKQIDKLNGGMFYHTKVYDVGGEVAHDACTFGTGLMKIVEDFDGKPLGERVFPDEVVVDEAEGLHRKPRSLYQYRAVARELLLEHPKYRRHKERIKMAALPDDLVVHRREIADQVAMVEAWHLPSHPDAEDGRHVIALDNCTLLDEPWTRTYHPFAVLRWSNRKLGFWGQGIPEQNAGLQYEINTLLRKAQEQMRLAGPKVFIERGANINPATLNNELWGIIEYTGVEPKMVVFQSVEPEIFAHIDRLYQRSFDEVGVSQLSARSEKPAGLNSGKALLAFNDIESSRFINFGQAYEQLYLTASDMMLDIARDSHLRPGKDGRKRAFVINYPTRTRGQRFLESVSWADINLAKDEYVIQVFPTSALPTTPVGKLQAVGDMIDRGMLKGDQAVSLLDFPDLEKVTGLITAAVDDIDMMVEQMLDEGIPLSPEPFSNLTLAVERMTSSLLRAKINKYPEERLELVRQYIAQADSMNKQLQAKLQAPSMATPQLPPGMAPPPVPVADAPGAGMPGQGVAA